VRRGLPIVLVAGCLAVAACGDDKRRPPAACTEGPAAVLDALRHAPERAELDGRPLSACLTDGSDGTDVQRVGTAWVEAAVTLADRARRAPEGRDALRMGFLVGAAERGAASTPGIHAELERRLQQEAAPLAESSAALARGRRAGRRLG
jgi:hypothetical protein